MTQFSRISREASVLERQAALALADAERRIGVPGARERHRSALERAIGLAEAVIEASDAPLETIVRACSTLVPRACRARPGCVPRGEPALAERAARPDARRVRGRLAARRDDRGGGRGVRARSGPAGVPIGRSRARERRARGRERSVRCAPRGRRAQPRVHVPHRSGLLVRRRLVPRGGGGPLGRRDPARARRGAGTPGRAVPARRRSGGPA